MAGWNEPRLDELFAAYRAALPDREPSASFTPEMWAKIDLRRKQNYSFGRFARGLVTAALAMCFAMTVVSWSPSANSVYSATYIDMLDDDPHDVDITHGETL